MLYYAKNHFLTRFMTFMSIFREIMIHYGKLLVCVWLKVAMALTHVINELIVHRAVHTLSCLIRHYVEALQEVAINTSRLPAQGHIL